MKKNSLSKVLSLSADSGIEPNFTKSNSVQSANLSAGLSGWCASAPLFFDDVYENGTRGKKQQAVASQTGRSMIEMLGVLAIIGVLSVGGIAGYSKAMMKYRINKTVDQVTTFVANVRTLFASQKNYKGLGTDGSTEGYRLAKKAHLFPDEMMVGTSGNYTDIENAFGGPVEFSYSSKNGSDSKAFTLDLLSIPEEACMELLTMNWGSSFSSGLIAMGLEGGTEDDGAVVGCNGKIAGSNTYGCPNGSVVPIPIPVSVAAQVCTSDNIISFKFY